MGAHAEAYSNPPGLHPSEPNYIWLEAGTNFGMLDDPDPAANHLASTDHLTTLLDTAGISWKTYQEGIFGDRLPAGQLRSLRRQAQPDDLLRRCDRWQ